ncbi:4-galactosyl-N-acetylglucosaminide 3-alpha-L-fucosyltransferase 9-like [Narcine bancroftii]|uniref:4-galactosyl-N-acetylglucosaminide 3-alpha-L-fucosyltransferase 9-like n=1 Tax=Narcine bancroftii TaxID=1343680 RepID=UPI0038314B1B
MSTPPPSSPMGGATSGTCRGNCDLYLLCEPNGWRGRRAGRFPRRCGSQPFQEDLLSPFFDGARLRFAVAPRFRLCGHTMRRSWCRRLSLAASVSVMFTTYLTVREFFRVSRTYGWQEGVGARSSAPRVTVLIWWPPFGREPKFANCEALSNINGCHLTTDRRLYPVSQAVIIHHRDLERNLHALPSGRRLLSQRWVWMNFESPTHSSRLEGLDGIFNWTMTYRRGSDLFIPYGYLYPREKSRRVVVPKKTKLVAWVLSNWNDEHARVKYYNQLKKYVDIDVYGRSGLDLKNDNVVQTVSPYKFYLAFENSQHVDYITEKLWRNAFLSGAVPVVLGPSRANYELFIPADSFIHVEDFSTPRKLAKYLMYLDENRARYEQYFQWKRHYNVHLTKFWGEQYCKVCEAVQRAGKQHKVISNLDAWFQ